jgi:hypothetical protein
MENGDNVLKSCECSNMCGEIQVPTEDELNALNAMRSLRQKARLLKLQLDRLERNEAGKEELEKDRVRLELDRLRREWLEWECRRQRASNERMILLGHEAP